MPRTIPTPAWPAAAAARLGAAARCTVDGAASRRTSAAPPPLSGELASAGAGDGRGFGGSLATGSSPSPASINRRTAALMLNPCSPAKASTRALRLSGMRTGTGFDGIGAAFILYTRRLCIHAPKRPVYTPRAAPIRAANFRRWGALALSLVGFGAAGGGSDGSAVCSGLSIAGEWVEGLERLRPAARASVRPGKDPSARRGRRRGVRSPFTVQTGVHL